MARDERAGPDRQTTGEAERGTVLILEDDLGVATLERLRLERQGYTVRIAATTQAARQAIEQQEIDLILLDYRLEGDASGLDFYRQLQAAGYELPAILVSGVGNEPILTEAIRAGIRDFLPKTPEYLDDLPRVVDRLMKQVLAERGMAESEALRASNRRLQLLSEISSELFFREAPQEFIHTLYERLAPHMGLTAYWYHLLDEDRTLRLSGCSGLSGPAATTIERLSLGEGACGRTALERRPILLEDLEYSSDPHADRLRALGITAFACYPLIRGDLIGTFAVASSTQTCFHPEDLKLLRTLCDQVARAIERRRLYDRLEQERGRLEAVLRQMPAGVLIAQAPSGRLLLSNEQVQQIWRSPRKPAETIHAYREHLGFHTDGRPYEPEAWPLSRSIDTGEVVTHEEIEFPRDDETRGTMLVSASPVVDREGRIVAGVATLHDITERKQAEQQIEKRERQQEAANELGLMALVGGDLSTLLERAVLLVQQTLGTECVELLELLPDGKTLALRAGVGWKPGTVGRSTEAVDRETLAGYTLAQPADRAVVVEDLRAETRFSSPSLLHDHGIVSGMTTLIWGREGPYGVLGAHTRKRRQFPEESVRFLHSIAHILAMAIERKRLEAELRQRAEALEMADRRKDEFLAMLGHELRNPLSPIYNALQLMRGHNSSDARAAWSLEILERQFRHMDRIIDDLLNLSRIAEGKIQLRREPVDLARVVRETAKDHRALLDEADLALHLELPEAPVWVEGDATRLAQVVSNLLTNAAKFTDRSGQVTVRLATDTTEDPPLAVVSVRDTGVGIEPEMLAHVFDRLVQSDRNLGRSRGGLGLGLSLVKGLVELHGGRVRAQSAGPGQGSEFVISLPTIPPPARSEEVAPPGVGGAGAHRILVVDDNRAAADTLRELLHELGGTVKVAYSGTAAVEAARQFRPEVVLCDIDMPGMDGYQVAAALRRNPATADVRLIALTGHGQEADRSRAREAGFDLHLTKPVDVLKLCRALEGQPGRA